MTKKYILTGGPGTGKSSIILALEQKGEHTIPEAATDVIRYQQALGNKEPWTNPEFQDWILKLQLQREKNIPANIGRVFIDRGILDGAAYYIKDRKEYTPKLEQAIKEMEYEKKVFLVENFRRSCEKTETRREDLEDSLQLGRIIERLYREKGYEIIGAGPGTVQERMERILRKI